MLDYDKRLLWLVNQVAGTVPELCSKQKQVESKWSARKSVTVPDDDHRLRVPAARLEEAVEAERARIGRIEDKARGTVVGTTIAVSVAGAGIGMFAREGIFSSGGPATYLAAGVLLIGLAYFLGSGWLAVSAYAVSPLCQPRLEDRPEARATDCSGSSSAALDDDAPWRRELIDSLDLNQLLATMKVNRFSASIMLLRNGLISILLFAALAIGGSVSGQVRISPPADSATTPGCHLRHPR